MSTLLLVIVALAIAVALILANLPRQHSTPAAHDSAPTAIEFPRPSGATLSHIAYVYDGDTLYLQPDGTISRAAEIKVRLIGIDTPELRPAVECYGLEARDYLRGMLPKGTAVWILADREKLDKYGRSLLYLWTEDDRSVNLDLVEKGLATALRIAPSDSYWQKFAAAEELAKRSDAGQWGAC